MLGWLILRRVAQAAVTLFVTVTIVFLVGRISGSPADVILPQSSTPAERAALIQRFGFDQPMHIQYVRYLGQLAQGDLGESIRYRVPVMEVIGPRAGNSARLAMVAITITLLLAIPLGVAGAVRRGTWIERAALFLAVLGQSVPPFVLGVLLILVFGVWWQVLPPGGMESWTAYILPAVTMAWFISAGVVRLVRSSMLEVLDSEYVKLARAKGVPERTVIWRHAFANAAIPVTTFIGLMFGVILTAGVTVEVIFAWPGLGQLTYDSILARDYPLTQAAITISAALVILINFLVDMLYLALDPRVRV
jgi:peptide/nickel transport system permease protein